MASAASRTAGLALKAIPRPAAAIMSRSLAPSPTATVWLSGIAGLRREPAQGARLAGPVDDRPGDPPVSLPAGDLQRVGRREVQAEVGRQPVGELGEAAADHPAAVTQPLQRADQGPGARVPAAAPRGPLRRSASRSPASSATRSCSAAVKSSSPRIAASVRLGHLLRAAGPLGQQVDHLAGDQRGVDVHQHQPHRPPVQAAPLHRHVSPLVQRLAGQRGPQPVRVRAGDLQLDAGDGAVREPADPVDVGAVRRDPARDRRHRGGRQGAAEHGHMQAAAVPGLLTRAHGDLGGQVEVRGDGGDLAVDRGQVRGALAGQQRAQHELAADDDLLDVQHRQVVLGQGREQARRHPRPVTAGQGDQESYLRPGHQGPRYLGGAARRAPDAVGSSW